MFCHLLSSSSFRTPISIYFNICVFFFVLFVTSKIRKKKKKTETKVITSRNFYDNFVPSILTLTAKHIVKTIVNSFSPSSPAFKLGVIPDIRRWRWIKIHNFHSSRVSFYELAGAPLPEIKNTDWMWHSQVANSSRVLRARACVQSTFWILIWCKLIAGENSCNTMSV